LLLPSTLLYHHQRTEASLSQQRSTVSFNVIQVESDGVFLGFAAGLVLYYSHTFNNSTYMQNWIMGRYDPINDFLFLIYYFLYEKPYEITKMKPCFVINLNKIIITGKKL
jgi:hypothetical protein